MGDVKPSKLHKETYDLLIKLQEVLPGKPSLMSLVDDAVKLLAKKYLKKGRNDA